MYVVMMVLAPIQGSGLKEPVKYYYVDKEGIFSSADLFHARTFPTKKEACNATIGIPETVGGAPMLEIRLIQISDEDLFRIRLDGEGKHVANEWMKNGRVGS